MPVTAHVDDEEDASQGLGCCDGDGRADETQSFPFTPTVNQEHIGTKIVPDEEEVDEYCRLDELETIQPLGESPDASVWEQPDC